MAHLPRCRSTILARWRPSRSSNHPIIWTLKWWVARSWWLRAYPGIITPWCAIPITISRACHTWIRLCFASWTILIRSSKMYRPMRSRPTGFSMSARSTRTKLFPVTPCSQIKYPLAMKRSGWTRTILLWRMSTCARRLRWLLTTIS